MGQEDSRRAAARAGAATTYQGVAMATAEGEGGAAALLARTQLEILKAYDPRWV